MRSSWSVECRVASTWPLRIILLSALASGCHRGHPSAARVSATPDAGRKATAAPVSPPVWERKVVAEPPIGKQIDVDQIVLTYNGSTAPWTPPRGRKRSLAQARALAAEIVAKARAGADFEKLAIEYSDWPFAARAGTPGYGGRLGLLTEGTPLFEAFRIVPFQLAVGAVSDPVPSPFGLHIFRRLPAIRVSEILLTYAGSSPRHAPRSKEEAERLAQTIARELSMGKPFADEAFAYSDDLVSAGRGGDLGTFDDRATQPAAILQTARQLRPGQVSAPFVAPGGIAIVRRTD